MRKYLAVAVVALSLFSTPARAQMATIDFANLIQGILDVISTISQEAGQAEQIATQASQYYTQVQQYNAQYQQLQNDYQMIKSINVDSIGGVLNTVGTGLAKKQDYERKVKGLYGTLSDAEVVMTKKYNAQAASGLSTEDWMKRETELNKARQEGNGFLTHYEQGLLESVEDRYKEVKDLQGEISITTGTHSAMQLMNAQMNALLGTVNQMLEHNTFMAQRQTSRDVEDEGAKKASVTKRGEVNKDWVAARAASQAKIDAMKSAQ